jgi:hypothetical protein
VYGISERTLYNMLGAPAQKTVAKVDGQGFLFPEMLEERKSEGTVGGPSGTVTGRAVV